jgi:hypothetical protein
MQDTWTVKVPCRDGAGRERQASVLITADFNVAVVTPAGDSAVWHPGDLNRLVEVIRAAQVEALHRRGMR